jgi:hypothetical protein
MSSWSSGAVVFGTSTGIFTGFHVAAEGIPGPEMMGDTTRPSAKAASAAAAAAAMALARSSLNCCRSALRFAVISSEVSSTNMTTLCENQMNVI